jgi:flagellar motor switch protein FliN/FliY
MSQAFDPALRDLSLPPEPAAPGGAAPSAHVLAMSELDPRVGEGANGTPRHGPSSPVAPADLQAALRHVRARLTVCVGSAEITLGELLGAQEHHVLKLDRAVDQPVDVLLEGQVVARGTLVAVDDHFAVRITELPRPAAPTPGRG